MNILVNTKIRELCFAIVTFFFFTISFSTNVFQIADSNYRFFDRIDELFVISRLHISENEHFMTNGALPGITIQSSNPTTSTDQKDLELEIGRKYDDYINGLKQTSDNYAVYKSHPGGQANLYVALQILLPFDNAIKLYIFRLITILLSSLALCLFLTWVYRNFKFIPAITTFILLLFTPIIIAFSYNLWWAYWSYYIPFLTMLLVLDQRKRLELDLFDYKLLIYLAIASFLKFFFTGAEFITTTMIMSLCPIVYYMILEKREWLKNFIYLVKAGISSLIGILVGLGLLITQVRLHLGTWDEAAEHIIDAFFRRSFYNEDIVNASVVSTIQMFCETFPYTLSFLRKLNLTYGILILLICALSLIIIYLSKKLKKEQYQKNLALVITTVFSIGAPLSWILIFTQHAMYHKLDIIVMYMPYCLFGFTVIGVFINMAVNSFRKKFEDSSKISD